MRASEQFKKKNIVTCAYSYHFGFGFIVLTFYLNPFWLKVMIPVLVVLFTIMMVILLLLMVIIIIIMIIIIIAMKLHVSLLIVR